jgi:hypothetical protein
MEVYKLGKTVPRFDHRTLRMSRYRTGQIVVPPEVSWLTKIDPANRWPMYFNDSIGDCVPAAAGHCIEQWTTYAGNPFIPAPADILKAYEDPTVGGYVPDNASNPQTNATDNGATLLDMLNYWRQTGIGGHKIFAYVSVNPKNALEVREAVMLFGNVYMGVQLPTSVQGFDSWTVPDGGTASQNGQPGSWGGHCVPVVAVSPESLTCITWGSVLKMSHNFFSDYCDELYAVLSLDWIEQNGLSVIVYLRQYMLVLRHAIQPRSAIKNCRKITREKLRGSLPDLSSDDRVDARSRSSSSSDWTSTVWLRIGTVPSDDRRELPKLRQHGSVQRICARLGQPAGVWSLIWKDLRETQIQSSFRLAPRSHLKWCQLP